MIIHEKLLEATGATRLQFDSRETIFAENDIPRFYYQIVMGRVKLNNYCEDGKEILQHILEEGQSVGESSLFIENVVYPVNAIAITPCTLLRLTQCQFYNLLIEKPEISMEINRRISEFLYFKQIMGQILCTHSPLFKIKALLDYLKNNQENREPFSFQIPFTRQELANLTGLCVETTIRAVKTMEKKHLLKIRHRKILY